MSIWDKEIIKANGELYCFVRIQNEFTGNISGAFKKVYYKDGHHYCKADGSTQILDEDVARFNLRQSELKKLVEEAHVLPKLYL